MSSLDSVRLSAISNAASPDSMTEIFPLVSSYWLYFKDDVGVGAAFLLRERRGERDKGLQQVEQLLYSPSVCRVSLRKHGSHKLIWEMKTGTHISTLDFSTVATVQQVFTGHLVLCQSLDKDNPSLLWVSHTALI